jgi:RNA recognition motif-containing protein
MPVRLFVGNLPYDASEEEIREHFSSVGTLSYVFIPLDRETGKKRGFAFVEFNDAEQAKAAIERFNNQPFKGRNLAVNEARARDSSAPRPSPGAGGGFRSPGTGGGFRPASGGFRPSGPPTRGPAPSGGFGEPSIDSPSRGDRPNRKQFGPDAKPVRNRAKNFKTEGGKKSFKEKFTGQIFSAEDEDELTGNDVDIDNFATGVDADSEDQ